MRPFRSPEGAKEREWVAEDSDRGLRLDRFLAFKNPDLSRTRLAHLIEEGYVEVNRQEKDPSYRVKKDDFVRLVLPPAAKTDILPEAIPLHILFEDSSIVVVNKPPGMLVHPVKDRYSGTLVNALLAHGKDLKGMGGEVRPGIVHRLDRDTSGVIVVAKDEHSHTSLMRQFKNRQVKKGYVALVYGVPREKEGVLDLPIGRSIRNRQKMAAYRKSVRGGRLKTREARTRYRVVQSWDNFSMLEIYPETGRTHQIRVHLSNLGHPIAGDTTYTRRKPPEWAPRQMLHARAIEFRHPVSNRVVCFEAPLPSDFEEAIRAAVSE